ncbi:4Fe-4S binding protein [Salisediminibacterium selenitireducens]|uniref:4Fe-4S ferredoxin iron-sulfur binding domain protein n=1 Tax=Bacillus selenitireducens (strain ATCC 700615 / DSM 15326 / MLS10) TaxID=439292 RepID=D6XVC6_BACIE|nr:4Fe-4S binding protein [Salisediminibacterium selenitireducens]ADH99664.1 4Fe-4S ferredoxin iron-sulfur binding domain protein [[Bacillus] selenitireducens MLS10]
MIRVQFHEETCKGCGLCVSVCPQQIIQTADRMNAKGYQPVEVVNQEACTSCTACARMCPDAVISVFRPKKTA